MTFSRAIRRRVVTDYPTKFAYKMMMIDRVSCKFPAYDCNPAVHDELLKSRSRASDRVQVSIVVVIYTRYRGIQSALLSIRRTNIPFLFGIRHPAY